MRCVLAARRWQRGSDVWIVVVVVIAHRRVLVHNIARLQKHCLQGRLRRLLVGGCRGCHTRKLHELILALWSLTRIDRGDLATTGGLGLRERALGIIRTLAGSTPLCISRNDRINL